MKTTRLAVAAMCCAAMLFGGCSGRKSEQYRKEGDVLLQIGKTEDAKGAYVRALEMNATNAQAKLGMARCAVAAGKATEALPLFREAIALDPALVSAYEEAIRLLLKQNSAGEAEELAKKLEAKDKVQSERLLANIWMEGGKVSEAVDVFQRLSKEAPDNFKIQRDLATALVALNKPQEADALLRAILASNRIEGDAMAIHLMLIEAARAQGKEQAIAGEYKELAQKNPEDNAILLSYIQALLNAGQNAEAEQAARAFYAKTPESAWGNCMLGACLVSQKNFSDAVPYLERAAASLPNQAFVRKLLALAQSGGKAGAPSVAQIAPTGPALPAAATQEAVTADWPDLWKNAEFKAMVARRADFLKANAQNAAETLAVAAFCLQDQAALGELEASVPADSPLRALLKAVTAKQIDQVISQVEAWKETDPERKVLRANAAGVALGLLGARLQGIQLLTESLSASPEYGATYYNLAQVLRLAACPEAAARVLQKLAGVAVSNVDVHCLLWQVLRENRLLKEAQSAAEVAYSLFPDKEVTGINLAQTYLDAQNLELAEKVLRRALQDHPGSPRFSQAMARLLLYANRLPELPGILNVAPDTFDPKPLLGDLAGYYHAASGAWDKALAEAEALAQQEAAPIKWLRLTALLRLNRSADAVALLAGVQNPTPNERIVLAALGQTSNQEKEERDLAERLTSKPEALPLYTEGLAYLFLPAYNPAMAKVRQAFDAVNGDAVLASILLDCAARALPAAGQTAMAEEFTKQNYASAQVWTSLAGVYGVLKDTASQEKALDQAIAVAPESTAVWRNKAYFYETIGAPADAAKAYSQVLKLAPNDLAANNNLAYCLLLSDGDLDQALSCAQQAVALAPSEPNVLHTLSVIQLKKGDLDSCAKNIKLAISLHPVEPTFLLDYGKLLIAQNRPDEAVVQINSALQYASSMGLPFARRSEAETLLKQYGGAQPATAVPAEAASAAT